MDPSARTTLDRIEDGDGRAAEAIPRAIERTSRSAKK